ncbi:NAD-dependent epimerase/dehydratase family protein, partial [Microcystis sp.]|uniref:NAD-dependent epimerase/dehydratase family protein n=1 Tax=Microcystis sp. TaxID=1127 RepID=UPI00391A1B58
MKTILVTGATGFIGCHLLPVLHQQGWQTTAAVRDDFRQPLSIPIKTNTVGEREETTARQEALLRNATVIHRAGRAHI